MGKKNEKEIDLNNLKPEEIEKYEIAEELGYLDKVMATGWKSLTAKESGRIGGIMTKRKREQQKNKENSTENKENSTENKENNIDNKENNTDNKENKYDNISERIMENHLENSSNLN